MAVRIFLWGLFCFFAAVLLTGCNSSSSKPKPPSSLASVSLSGWKVAYSPGVSSVSGSWSVPFPVEANPDRCAVKKHTCKSVHYVWKDVNSKISGKSEAYMSFVISAPNVKTWNYKLEPTNNGSSPASVRFILQRKNDNMSVNGGRFWSTEGYVLKHGAGSLKVPLSRTKWTTVYGKTPTQSEWRAMMDNIGRVGVTFGGGSFYGHGVNVTGGSAKFTMKGYRFR